MIAVTPARARSKARRGVGHAGRVGAHLARRRFHRQIQAGARDVRVGGVEQGEVTGVAAGEIDAQIIGEAEHAVGVALGAADQGDPLSGQAAEVDGLAATHAADTYRETRGRRFARRRVPQAQDA